MSERVYSVTVIIVSLGKTLSMPVERVVGSFDDVERWVREHYTEREVLEVIVESSPRG